MKWCQNHWDELKNAIKQKGLYHLVAKNGEEVIDRVTAELRGEETLANYDPLMSAFWMINGRATEIGGIYLLMGEYCPLCELDKHAKNPDGSELNPKASVRWIEGCTEQIKHDCENMGLKPIFPNSEEVSG